MRVAVVGAGAIGGAIAHALWRAGADPLLVARKATAEAIAARGLRVRRLGVEETSRPRAAAEPRTAGRQDIVIGALKAQDWASALPLFAPLIGPNTIVLPAVNGVPWWYFQREGGVFDARRLASLDPDGALEAAFAPERLIGTVVYMAVSRAGPTELDWPTGERLVLGAIASQGASPSPAAGMLRAAGFAVDTEADIRRAVWAKLLGNVGFNPVSALERATVAAIVGAPRPLATVRAAMIETLAVARAVGRAPDIGIDARIEQARRLGDFKTSMLQDREAGRAMEIGALLDAPREIGALAGVPTPTLDALARARYVRSETTCSWKPRARAKKTKSARSSIERFFGWPDAAGFESRDAARRAQSLSS
ncbi:MAG: 2-dehydropantoate 2-reductase [Tagaea sp.]|nr:2-dehydropantoate 2-reductase [Tagaea sp.]